MSDPATTTTPPADPPKKIIVDLPGGIKVEVGEAEGRAMIAMRDSGKETARMLGELQAQIKADKDAAAADKAKAEDAEAIKKGNYDAVLARQKAEQEVAVNAERARAQTLEKRLVESSLSASVRGNQTLVAGAEEDVQAILSSRYSLKLDGNGVLIASDRAGQPVLNPDGSAKSVDTLVSEILSTKPHLRKTTVATGTGASGAARSTAVVTITKDQIKVGNKEQMAAIISGQIVVAEG